MSLIQTSFDGGLVDPGSGRGFFYKHIDGQAHQNDGKGFSKDIGGNMFHQPGPYLSADDDADAQKEAGPV